MTAAATCSPGSHSHSDRPNWRPAETYEEYLQNCRDGLEQYSERHVAKLLGMTRMELYRSSLIGELPEGLFEHILLERRRLGFSISTKALAQVAVALRRRHNVAEVERCPHCAAILRIRGLVSDQLADVVNEWLAVPHDT